MLLLLLLLLMLLFFQIHVSGLCGIGQACFDPVNNQEELFMARSYIRKGPVLLLHKSCELLRCQWMCVELRFELMSNVKHDTCTCTWNVTTMPPTT